MFCDGEGGAGKNACMTLLTSIRPMDEDRQHPTLTVEERKELLPTTTTNTTSLRLSGFYLGLPG